MFTALYRSGTGRPAISRGLPLIKTSRYWLLVGLSLLLGGALGNFYDRIALGYVVDFLDFHLNGWHWPPFNFADSAICTGAICIMIDMLFCSDSKASLQHSR